MSRMLNKKKGGPLSQSIPKDVIVENRREVRAYLQEFSDLSRVVPAICQRTRAEFGDNAQLILKVCHDPDEPSHHLNLTVRLPDYDSNVMERIYAITDEFDDPLTDTKGFFHVTTDFRVITPDHGI